MAFLPVGRLSWRPHYFRTDARAPPLWSVEELDALLCQIESRIKKTPAFRAGIFLYANKSGARGVGGKHPTHGYFGPAAILTIVSHGSEPAEKRANLQSAPRQVLSLLLRGAADSRAKRSLAKVCCGQRIVHS